MEFPPLVIGASAVKNRKCGQIEREAGGQWKKFGNNQKEFRAMSAVQLPDQETFLFNANVVQGHHQSIICA